MRIANAKGIAGTLGALVHPDTQQEDARPLLLTTGHTLLTGTASWQDTIWLVTDARGSRRYHKLGHTLTGKIGNIRLNGTDYFVDCAIGSCSGVFDMPGTDVCSLLPNILGTSDAEIGMPVSKTGATTLTTHGIVANTDYSCDVQAAGGLQRATRQLLVRATEDGKRFADDGDSGALVVDASHRAVGLLWGNTPEGHGVACPIAPVLAALNVSFSMSAP